MAGVESHVQVMAGADIFAESWKNNLGYGFCLSTQFYQDLRDSVRECFVCERKAILLCYVEEHHGVAVCASCLRKMLERLELEVKNKEADVKRYGLTD